MKTAGRGEPIREYGEGVVFDLAGGMENPDQPHEIGAV
jgi:hypothetical protein